MNCRFVDFSDYHQVSSTGPGYEFRLSRIAAFTINADWMFQVLDDKSGGTDSTSLFLFTVGLTFPRIG